MIVLVSYFGPTDSSNERRPVENMLRNQPDAYMPVLGNQWVVKTGEALEAWHRRMKDEMPEGAYWLITELRRPYMS